VPQTSVEIAGKRWIKNSAIVRHGPSGRTTQLGLTPFRVGGGGILSFIFF
jgi:hypothetical protein